MPVETNPQFIEQLNETWPSGTESISEGDDHLRNVKSVLKYQFPQLGTTIITATGAQINNACDRETGRGGFYVDDTDTKQHAMNGTSWVTLAPASTGALLPDSRNITASPGTGVVQLNATEQPSVAFINYSVSVLLTGFNVTGEPQVRFQVVRTDNSRVEGTKFVRDIRIDSTNEGVFIGATSTVYDANPSLIETYRAQINTIAGVSMEAKITSMNFWVSYSTQSGDI